MRSRSTPSQGLVRRFRRGGFLKCGIEWGLPRCVWQRCWMPRGSSASFISPRRRPGATRPKPKPPNPPVSDSPVLGEARPRRQAAMNRLRAYLSRLLPFVCCGTPTATLCTSCQWQILECLWRGPTPRFVSWRSTRPSRWIRTVPCECYSLRASNRLRELLPAGARAWALEDVEPLDPFERTLLYLWDDNGLFVNEAMVEEGFAEAVLFEPNDLYIRQMRAAERQARAAGRGLWGACALPRSGGRSSAVPRKRRLRSLRRTPTRGSTSAIKPTTLGMATTLRVGTSSTPGMTMQMAMDRCVSSERPRQRQPTQTWESHGQRNRATDLHLVPAE